MRHPIDTCRAHMSHSTCLASSTLHTARGMCAFGYLGTHTKCYPTCTDTEGYPTCAVLWQLNNASAVPAALAALASCVPTIC